MNRKIEAYLFDRDGTLIDFDPTWGACAISMFNALADGDVTKIATLCKVSKFDSSALKFAPDSMILTQSPVSYGGIWADIVGVPFDQEFLDRIGALLLEGCTQNVTPFDDTVSTIEAIAARSLPIGLATNGTQATAERMLAKLGLGSHFSFISGYDSGHGRKPEPGQIFAFAEQTSIDPSTIAMVGDSTHDLDAARTAGAIGIGVLTGAQGRDILSARADLVIERLGDMTKLL